MPDPVAATSADRLRALTKAYGGEFSKTPQPDGSVIVRLHLPSGEVVAASGTTTLEAVVALTKRVNAFHAALTEGKV
jgi:hypothetical protein